MKKELAQLEALFKQTRERLPATRRSTTPTEEVMELDPATLQKFEELLKLPKVQPADLETLSPQEDSMFRNWVNHKAGQMKPYEAQQLYIKLEDINGFTEGDKWERNNNLIRRAIADYVRENRRMPSKMMLAEETGLHRNTISKHIKSMRSDEFFEEHKMQYTFMKEGVLNEVLAAALNGDIKAARLYLEMLSKTEKGGTVINTQNNYIQINNTALTQEVVARLQPEQLKQIEEMVKSVMS